MNWIKIEEAKDEYKYAAYHSDCGKFLLVRTVIPIEGIKNSEYKYEYKLYDLNYSPPSMIEPTK